MSVTAMLQDSLPLFTVIPVIALLAAVWIPRNNERIISRLTLWTLGLHLACMTLFVGLWLIEGCPTLDLKSLTLVRSRDFEFFIDFLFDGTTMVFASVGSLLTWLVGVFSKYYMHREDGFKRFFCSLLLFFTGFNLLVFSGNLETLLIGWEILGVTSFLLIAYFRDRYLPVKNGFKVLSFYRLGDICLMLAMWKCHHLFHRNVTFAEWSQASTMQSLFQEQYGMAMFVATMLVIAAAVKSAQLPFSTWLPRAMEGPTNSSAIFYGSLSVHSGAFLLLRTYPFWESAFEVRAMLIMIGLSTSYVATSIARAQPTVKTQIAYSSIAQLGLIFIEIAMGWHLLALIHFAGNSMLRTYQLLVSPSVLNYLVHQMFFEFKPQTRSNGNSLIQRIQLATYVLAIKEWNMDDWWYRYVWRALKWPGLRLNELDRGRGALYFGAYLLVAGIACGLGVACGFSGTGSLQLALAGLALAWVLKAFANRGEARQAWLDVAISQIWMCASMLLLDRIGWVEVSLYLCGTVLAAIVGYICLCRLCFVEGSLELSGYYGHSYEYRGLALVFLVCCLGFAGFPITPTFIGIDWLFTKVSEKQWGLVAMMALNSLVLELALIRIYARIFLGQHRKQYHPIAFRSS